MQQIELFFRLDDVSAISDTKAELQIFDAFRARGVKLCVAVVPFVGDTDGSMSDGRILLPFTHEKADIIKQHMSQGVLEIALHGYSHFSISQSTLSEFAGLDYETQKQRLIEGKRFLERLFNTRINVFVPPFNAYDIYTNKALDLLEFSVLSARVYGAALPNTRILFIPATCSLKDLRSAVAAARAAPDRRPLIVALFHHYDFKEVDPNRGMMTFGDLDPLLGWAAQQKDMTILSMQKAAERFGDDLSVRRFVAVSEWRRLEDFLPDRMKEKKPMLYYHEARALPLLQRKIVLLYSGLLILSALCSFSFVMPLSLFFPNTTQITTWGAAALLSITAMYSLRKFSLGRRGLAAIAISFGILLGALGCRLYQH